MLISELIIDVHKLRETHFYDQQNFIMELNGVYGYNPTASKLDLGNPPSLSL